MSESPRFEHPKTPEKGDEHFTAEEKAELYLERGNYLLEQLGKDALTGLNNRTAFNRELEKELKLYERSEGEEVSKFAIMFIDLDNFKDVNKKYGHQEGDQVLRRVAETLTQTVRSTDILSRFGGDEFYVLLPQTTEDEAVVVGNKILENLKNDPHLADHDIGASIGISSPHMSKDAEELVRFADAAANEVKREGKNQVKVYTSGT